jgi:hypothetical protein
VLKNDEGGVELVYPECKYLHLLIYILVIRIDTNTTSQTLETDYTNP